MRRRRANEAIERLSAKHAIEEKERTGQASAGARNFNQSSKDELKSSKLSTLSLISSNPGPSRNEKSKPSKQVNQFNASVIFCHSLLVIIVNTAPTFINVPST